MESKPFRRVAFRPVFFIADNRTTQGGELDADLMPAAGFQGQFNEGEVPTLFEKAVVGHGMSRFFGGRADENLEGIGFIKVGFDGS